MQLRLSTTICTLLAGLLLTAAGCADDTATQVHTDASLVVRARVVASAAKTTAAEQTTWDSLIIKVALPDGDTVRHSSALSDGDAVAIDTVPAIPPGQDITVLVSTVNGDGITVHRSSPQQVDLAPGETGSVSVWLNPTRTSLYIELSDVPTSVDSVAACFVAQGDTFTTMVDRATRVTALTLDYIPDGTAGTLTIAGLSTDRDTLYSATVAVTVYADRLETIWVRFTETPAGIAMDATVVAPAPTLVAGVMDGVAADTTEAGGIVVSEIMYMANGSEYIELHNPSPDSVYYDSLILCKDGDSRTVVGVGIAAGGFYVVARADSSWADTSLSFLDLSSTSGNWLTVCTPSMTVLDWVAFVVRSNDLGWPNIPSARAAIVLDSLSADPSYNNYGEHWVEATSPVPADSMLWGTPGTSGQ